MESDASEEHGRSTMLQSQTSACYPALRCMPSICPRHASPPRVHQSREMQQPVASLADPSGYEKWLARSC